MLDVEMIEFAESCRISGRAELLMEVVAGRKVLADAKVELLGMPKPAARPAPPRAGPMPVAPAAAAAPSALAAAFERDVAVRRAELAAVAASFHGTGVQPHHLADHLPAIAGWDRHFTTARARAAEPTNAATSWDTAFSAAHAR